MPFRKAGAGDTSPRDTPASSGAHSLDFTARSLSEPHTGMRGGRSAIRMHSTLSSGEAKVFNPSTRISSPQSQSLDGLGVNFFSPSDKLANNV